MDDPETSSQAGLVRGSPEGPTEEQQTKSWKERTGEKLESNHFHSTIFTLIVIDCIIVVIELCFTLLAECTPGGGGDGEGNRPQWLQILLYMSMAISALFLLELPVHAWAFGLRYYNPWSEVQHSTFHLLDALIIVMNFTIIFLQGPAQEIVGLLVILRLWRLVKLLGGVAEGVEGLNRTLRHSLETCEKELASKTQQLDEANRKLDTLQRKLDAMQP